MPAWRLALLLCLAFSSAGLVHRASADFGDDFKLKNELKGSSSLRQRRDLFGTTTRRPVATRAPSKPDASDFSLYDALDDVDDKPKKPDLGTGGGGFSDQDLKDILDDNYKPDKGDGRSSSDDSPESGMPAETGTIAGVASALAMALVGAISSYISYQQKKFCFSIQQGVNANYAKGENLQAVVCEEPQVTFSEVQSAPPPEPRI
ncbi:CD99 antigen-like protein 2 [Suncus etruscus]|uniref:CD99 antigen-like protein 2 n=1 Tax=Suncus etruscus TaxID=109475 RepID=UPI00210F832F|nr:CD99 antigen-like protein 2 [Suncus etruscus]